MPFHVSVHNRYRIAKVTSRSEDYVHDDPVEGAALHFIPSGEAAASQPIPALRRAADGHTNRRGRARLEIPDQNGSYVLRIIPEYWTLDPVGPALSRPFRAGAGRIYRPLNVKVKVEGNPHRPQISAAVVLNGLAHGEVWKQTSNAIELLLQPVWVTDHVGRRASRANVDLIVLHLTSGSHPYGAMRTIAKKNGAHYLILKESGQIVKFLEDGIVGGHAGSGGRPGNSRWAGATNINNRSIGIELENVTASDADSDFSDAQYDSLLGLLQKLVDRHGVAPKRIIGHSDVAVELDIKSWDPGLKFDWPRLDRAGFGLTGPGSGYPSLRSLMAAGPESLGKTVYGGLFKGRPDDPELRTGDNDTTATYGGRRLEGITGQPILELLTDLHAIGYWVGHRGPTAELTREAARAAMHFQHHFFAMERTSLPANEPDVRIDRETALRIRDVAAMN